MEPRRQKVAGLGSDVQLGWWSETGETLLETSLEMSEELPEGTLVQKLFCGVGGEFLRGVKVKAEYNRVVQTSLEVEAIEAANTGELGSVTERVLVEVGELRRSLKFI